jgi:hypothetical protein
MYSFSQSAFEVWTSAPPIFNFTFLGDRENAGKSWPECPLDFSFDAHSFQVVQIRPLLHHPALDLHSISPCRPNAHFTRSTTLEIPTFTMSAIRPHLWQPLSKLNIGKVYDLWSLAGVDSHSRRPAAAVELLHFAVMHRIRPEKNEYNKGS